MVSIPGLGRSPGEGNGNPLQYPCLENSMHSDGLQSVGSERVRHTHTHTSKHTIEKLKRQPTGWEKCLQIIYLIQG